ncbi:PA14 domain-containing protein [Spirosoma areae]
MTRKLRSGITPTLFQLLLIVLSIAHSSFAEDNPAGKARKPEFTAAKGRLIAPFAALPMPRPVSRLFDADPIRFILRADKPTAAIGEEITLTVSAHYLNIPSALLFTTAGSTAFRLKLLMPDGFVQTGGENLEYVGTELSATKPTLTYTLKGYFTKAGNTTEFRLLRSHANADANSLFIEKARLTIRLTPTENSAQQHQKGARSAAISNGVGFLDEADCNSVRGWAADQGQPNVAVEVDFFIDGQYAGSTQASQSRPDVGAYLGDNGNHGFSFTLPQSFRSGGNHSVEARFSGTAQGLNSGPKAYACSGSSSTPSTTPTPSSGGCNYAEGQFLLNFNGELIYAHYHNGVLFAAYQNASEGFKPQHWMQAAGFDANKVPCFAATDPRLGSAPSTPATNPASGSNNGTGLLGTYYNNTNLSGNPVRQQVDATVNFTWGDQGPSPAAGANATNLSVRWSGQVEAPVSGTYKFKTFNDDATRLSINGQQLINDWPGGHGPTWFEGSINLTAGQKYSISLEFNQGYGGAQAQLYWEYPGQGSQLIPQSRLYPDGASSVPTSNPSPTPTTGNCGYAEGQFLLNFNGELIYAHYYNGVLFAAYQNAQEGFKPRHWMQAAGYDQSKVPCFAASDPRLGTTTPPTNNPNPTGGCGTGSGLTGFYSNSSDLSGNLVAIRTDARIDFAWNNDSPIPNVVSADNFSLRWIGQVEAPVSGNYTFKTNNDDGTRVWVNGQLLIDDWNGHGPTWRQGSISLNVGQKYDIVIDFVDFGGGAQAQLYWEYPGQGLQIVPSCRLYPLLTTSDPTAAATRVCYFSTYCVDYAIDCRSGAILDDKIKESCLSSPSPRPRGGGGGGGVPGGPATPQLPVFERPNSTISPVLTGKPLDQYSPFELIIEGNRVLRELGLTSIDQLEKPDFPPILYLEWINQMQKVSRETYILQQLNPNWSSFRCLLQAQANVSLGKVHFLLDAFGLIPGAGEAADGISGGIYLLEGDNTNAALSFGAMMPIGGWAATGGKWARNALKYDGVGGYVSKSGLTFKFFGKENRLDHVLNHMKDDLSKQGGIHGVFYGTAKDVISTVDEAWEIIKRNNISPSISSTGNYNYVVDMGRVIGWEGGSAGSKAPVTKLLISTKPNSDAVLVTSFPIR